MKTRSLLCIYLFIVTLFVAKVAYAQELDPLPSWNEGTIKTAIIQFVERVIDKNSPNYVAPEDRIATFDNDGTLWVEQPIYTQMIFAFDRIKTLASTHPEWKKQTPFKYVLDNRYDKLGIEELEKIIAVTQSGMTIEDYQRIAKQWFDIAKNPRFKQPYTKLVYQPMLEVMHYLKENNFKVYIVSGGGQDFMRAFAPGIYGVMPENIIGSVEKTNYAYQNNKPVLMKTAHILLLDVNQGKPEAINLFIGKKPIVAFGNSTGDRQMLEWTQSNEKTHLMLLVHHDDARREYAYGPHSKVGTFSNALMKEAIYHHWQIISMKKDWKTIFSFEE